MMGCGALGGVNIIDSVSGAEKVKLRNQTEDLAGGVDAFAWASCSRRLAAGMMYGESDQPTAVVWDVRKTRRPSCGYQSAPGRRAQAGWANRRRRSCGRPTAHSSPSGGTPQLFASDSGQRLREICAAQGGYCVYSFSPNWRLAAGG